MSAGPGRSAGRPPASLLWDALALAGLALALAGVACWSGPAALVLAGGVLLWVAYQGHGGPPGPPRPQPQP